MSLLRFELLKLFTRKVIYITAFFLLALVSLTYYQTLSHGGKLDTFTDYQKWEGPVTQEKYNHASEIRNEIDKRITTSNSMTQEDIRIYPVLVDVLNVGDEKQMYEDQLSKLQNAIQKTNGYTKKKFQLQYETLKRIKEPELYYVHPWNSFVDYVNIQGALIIGAMILVGLSQMFTSEYSSGVHQFILSSRKGRRQVVTAKFIASTIYVFCIATFFFLIQLVFTIKTFGSYNWDTPIRNVMLYQSTPYDLRIWQFISIEFLVYLIGSLAFAYFVLLVSSCLKSSILSFFISGCVFAFPIVSEKILGLQFAWLKSIASFSYTVIIRCKTLFNQFQSYDVLGHPVLILNLALWILLIVTALVIALTYRRFKTIQVR